jgi:hypothetical protein
MSHRRPSGAAATARCFAPDAFTTSCGFALSTFQTAIFLMVG